MEKYKEELKYYFNLDGKDRRIRMCPTCRIFTMESPSGEIRCPICYAEFKNDEWTQDDNAYGEIRNLKARVEQLEERLKEQT